MGEAGHDGHSRAEVPSAGWLRDAEFDRAFILGIAGIALLSGAAVTLEPRLWAPILLADLWLLGYHHVISTYTRLCFDKESFREHRFLVLWLPLIVIAAVAAVGMGIGLWVLATVYLYWQWFHYTRQSWGVSQVYRRKSDGLVADSALTGKLMIYLVPLWGILYRSHQDPGTFLGVELRVVPVPEWAVQIAGAAALATLAWWAWTRLVAWRQGRLAVAHTLYMVSHFAIFATGYVLIEDINHGWLVINIWPNAQYIAFVWLFNNNRFRGGAQPQARVLSRISQRRNVWAYVAVCLGISTVAYLLLAKVTALLLVAPIIVYQAVNFHHYIVDSVIWKVRRPALQRTLDLKAG